MGVELLMVGAVGWPTADMGFWRPAVGELSLAAESRDKKNKRSELQCCNATKKFVATLQKQTRCVCA